MKKQFLVLMSLVVMILGSFTTAYAQNLYDNEIQTDAFPPTNYRMWRWLGSDCHNCPIMIITNREMLHSEEVTEFIQAIAQYKTELVELYKIDGQEYNLLAHMAIGILGRESTFFTGKRYWLKEHFPFAVRIMKTAKWLWNGGEGSITDSSRGPTQIKVIPKKIAETYKITTADLGNPTKAALATMGFLIQSLPELKRRVVINKLDEITPETYVDYLPYIYMGSTRRLVNRNPTPAQLNYIREMKEWMEWVIIYELPENNDLPLSAP